MSNRGKLCLTNLLVFFEKVKHADKGDPVDILYFDFQIVFDNVLYQQLLRN